MGFNILIHSQLARGERTSFFFNNIHHFTLLKKKKKKKEKKERKGERANSEGDGGRWTVCEQHYL